MITPGLLAQFTLAGLMIGVLYALMALGITFIYGVMRTINWAMGEFYMIGSFVQYALVSWLLGPDLWWLALPVTGASVFALGMVVQRLLLRPMFVNRIERRDEYATVITIALVLLLRNLAAIVNGPYQHRPPSHLPDLALGPLDLPGAEVAAAVAAVVVLGLFFLGLRGTWLGLALRAAAQNRMGAQTAGIDLLRLDMVAFGIGVALAALAGGLLAPVYLVYPTNGAVTTTKGFEIIVIGGLGSIWEALVGGLVLGLAEALGSALIAPAYQNAYGFLLLIALLLVRPTGLFGERARAV
ncbi:MAG TPA: branched-chain amino acid ABC transporter permease [Candidatus Dormibacteraeota bacterium]|nr:branched-chain amino acid ABC transporter permease [Candidatus Dormibacteraeota bacterium]